MLRLRTLSAVLIAILWSLAASLAFAADRLHMILVQGHVAGADVDCMNMNEVAFTYNDLTQTDGLQTFVVQEKEGGNRKAIFDAIDEVAEKAGPRDVILFYYSGHGAIDERGHFLQLDDRAKLHRDELRQKLAAVNGRLKIIISDCCSVVTVPNPPTAMPPDENEARRRRFLRNMTNLLSVNGTFDITSASQGEIAWGTKKGGLFTSQLYRILFNEEVADWSALKKRVTDSTMASYRDYRARNINSGGRADGISQAELRMLRNQAQQQPHVFAMQLAAGMAPKVVGNPPPAVGPPVDPKPVAPASQGVLVTKVNADSTATTLWLNRTQMKLEEGDRILAINGQQISDPDKFGELIDGMARGASFNLLIIDGNSGKKMELRGKLDVGGKYRFGATVEDR